ncbi:MAG: TonB-dependent receptor, partial [Acidobacteriota bacterium]
MILSTIRGTVVDPTGATVMNAEVTLVHLETNAKRTMLTNQNGDFEIAGLQLGTYRLSVSSAGFKTFVVENIILQSSEVRRINATLELGTVGTEVTVTAGAAVIATDTAKVEGTVFVRKYPDAPFININSSFLPQFLLTTQPLVQQIGAAWSAQWAGQSTGQIQQGQDGHTNDGFANQLNDVFDAEEIVMVTGNPTADIARVGYFNQVTKSGSNEFHGQFLYMHVNPALAARPFFATSKVKSLQHTFCNGVSGPIVKNKTFFYAAQNVAAIGSSRYFLQSAPTAKMRAGDFSQLLGLARPVAVRDPLTAAPFPGNLVPATRLDPLALKVNAKYLPAPNRGGPDDLANNFEFTFPYPTDLHVRKDTTVRIDHHVSSANRMMFRLIRDQTLYILNSAGWPEFLWTRKRDNYHIVGEDTHVFSPTLVNAARIGWYRERVFDGGEVYGRQPFKGDEAVKYLGLQGVNPQGLSAQGFPRMNITGMSSLYNQSGGLQSVDRNWGFADTVTWSRGKHVVKFGAEYKPQVRNLQPVKEGAYGVFTFNGTFTGYGYADFMLGVPYTSSRLNQLSNRTMLDSEFGAFITDDFKVSKRLTLSMGVRWDRFGSPRFDDGLMWNWDLASGNIVAPEAALKAVSPLYPKSINVVSGQATQNPSNRNLVPRLGAAYRITDRFVVRGAYGIYTETVGRYSRLLTAGPFEIGETYFNQIADGQPQFRFPNPFPSSIASAAIPSQSFTGYRLDTGNGRIHQFNVT